MKLWFIMNFSTFQPAPESSYFIIWYRDARVKFYTSLTDFFQYRIEYFCLCENLFILSAKLFKKRCLNNDPCDTMWHYASVNALLAMNALIALNALVAMKAPASVNALLSVNDKVEANSKSPGRRCSLQVIHHLRSSQHVPSASSIGNQCRLRLVHLFVDILSPKATFYTIEFWHAETCNICLCEQKIIKVNFLQKKNFYSV